MLTKDGLWVAPTQFLARRFPAYLKALGLGEIFTDPEWGLPLMLDHPQFLHDKTPVTISDPERGDVSQPGPMIILRETPAAIGTPAPTLGEHDATLPTRQTSMTSLIGDPSRTNAPLEGVTILDLGTMFAGPFGATLLADLGARVWKIEAVTGDPIRTAVAFPEAGAVR